MMCIKWITQKKNSQEEIYMEQLDFFLSNLISTWSLQNEKGSMYGLK
jgi:hypothetical protein